MPFEEGKLREDVYSIILIADIPVPPVGGV